MDYNVAHSGDADRRINNALGYDLVSAGSALMEFIPGPNGEFRPRCGGNAANVAVQAARLGGKAAFLGKIGTDHFGRELRQELLDAGVDIRGLFASRNVNTSLLFWNAEESLTFYMRHADAQWAENELHPEISRAGRIFHFDGMSLTNEPIFSTITQAVKAAREAGSAIAFSPCYHKGLWNDHKIAMALLRNGAFSADILLCDEHELFQITGKAEAIYGCTVLLEAGVKLVLVSQGKRGCYYATLRHRGLVRLAEADNDTTVDDSAAREAFTGAILGRMGASGETDLSQEALEESMRYALKAAALCRSRHGSMHALPSAAELADWEA